MKLVAKAGVKVAGKTFSRTMANPWLLAAVRLELGVGAVCKKLDMADDKARIVKKGSGFTSSVAIGIVLGGPIGAAGGAIWGVGEGVSKLFGWD